MRLSAIGPVALGRGSDDKTCFGRHVVFFEVMDSILYIISRNIVNGLQGARPVAFPMGVLDARYLTSMYGSAEAHF